MFTYIGGVLTIEKAEVSDSSVLDFLSTEETERVQTGGNIVS